MKRLFVILVLLIVLVSLYFIYTKSITSKDKKVDIKIEQINGLSHGNHWGAMFGFVDNIKEKVEPTFQDLEERKVLPSNVIIYQADYGIISHKAFVKGNKLITVFPILSITKSIPFKVYKVVEWREGDNLEAHIIGVGKDTFSIGFFATDYARNKKRYQKGDFSEVELSAFAYVVEKSNLGKESSSNSEVNISFAPEFCGFFPSSQLDTEFDYDFVGNVLSLQYFEYQGEKFTLFDIQLIQNEDLNFVIPMAVNVKNMRDSNIKVGDKIAGAFWLQGKIKER